MALSGTLQNFAGGVMLLLFRPFKCGDVIDALGFNGKVHEIQIFHTVLQTLDECIIYIPNGPLSASSLTILTEEGIRRGDFNFSVSNTENLKAVKAIILDVAMAHKNILKRPVPFVIVDAPTSGIWNFVLVAYSKTDEYLAVKNSIYEMVINEFAEKAISVPTPVLSVTLQKN